jgi:macrolide transport system ATP-binding/permease protein
VNVWAKLRYLLPSRRRGEERDMEEELASLKAMAGPHELGNLTLAAENAREVWAVMWLERLAQDLRYALGSMVHNKSFTALAVLSLALGIGANTAIFSFTESILIRALPVPDPDSLVVMKWRAQQYSSAATRGMSFSTGGTYSDPSIGTIGTQFPFPALEVFRRNADVLSSAFGYFAETFSLTIDRDTVSVSGQYVSGDYFGGMGGAPAAGRLIAESDDQSEAATVAVLGYRFAERRFGDAARAVGHTIRINDKPAQIVGVAPAGFFGAEPGAISDVYVPVRAKMLLEPAVVVARAAEQYADPNYYWIEIMGRLRSGVDLTRAQAVLAPQFKSFVESTVTTERQRASLPELRISPGAAGLDSLRRRYEKPVHVLMAIVGLILLIACANVANLLLARAESRRQEIAVRLSIGASRARIVRQLLTESVVLSSLSGLLGLAFAWWGIRVLTLLLANGRDNFTLHAELNAPVLFATLVLSVLTGLLFGLAPALQATRASVMSAIKGTRAGDQSGLARRSFAVSQPLAVAQIALSLVLLVAAGLFGRTLSNLHSINLGFSRENVLLFTISPRSSGYEGAALTRLYADLQDKLRRLPGVRSASLSSRALPAGGGTLLPVTAVGLPAPPPPAPGQRLANAAGILTVGPAFFETMQIPLKAGREFDARDSSSSTKVVVINERLVKVLGLRDAVGARLNVGSNETRDVVGVVGDALFLTLKEDLRPMVYVPYLQGSPQPRMTYEVWAAGNPLALANTVRQIVRQADYRLAVSDLKTQAAHIDQGIRQEIALARLCSAFALLALILACVGLYGMVAFAVTRRTAEIGIRMALGARRSGIIWLMVRSVLTLEMIGLAIGVPIVLAGSRYLESLMFGIRPNDPAAITAAVLLLFSAGLIASFLPARRASTIDPLVAVRNEAG